jgi:acetylornithine deacetylase/succinyl-diaminopimelate desuccinylase-like protein
VAQKLILDSWIETNRENLRRDYYEFLKIPSISTEPAFREDIGRCADWVRSYLAGSGLRAELLGAGTHPVVFGENLNAGSGRPTLLVYGHYDVQPVDPISLWDSPPFEPTERNGKIYARGALDDKGQIFYAMAAARLFHELDRPLPINIKFCIEGEEEAGSAELSRLLPSLRDKMKADFLLVVDYDSYDETTPAINLGARGVVSMEISLSGSSSDLHSGLCGGIAYNPNRALVELLASLYDEEGRVVVEGFYDDVQEVTPEELQAYSHQYSHDAFGKQFGITAFGGEKNRSAAEAVFFRPVLEINGIGGGYAGPGFKTVIPARAVAKLSCRLVPHQNPEKIAHQVISFLERRCPRGMQFEAKVHSGAPAYRANPQSKLALAVATACEEIMGAPCKRILSGASVPIVGDLVRFSQAEVVGMGYGLPTDQIHAPNEHFEWTRFERGLKTVARTIELL